MFKWIADAVPMQESKGVWSKPKDINLFSPTDTAQVFRNLLCSPSPVAGSWMNTSPQQGLHCFKVR